MDVTDQIIQSHIQYGGSDYNNPAYFAAQRSLNYACPGGSITKPAQYQVEYFPTEINWKDSVGLFGAENFFVKVTVDVDFKVITAEPVVNTYFPARVGDEVQTSDPYTTLNSGGSVPASGQAYADPTLDLEEILNTYEPARIQENVDPIYDGVLSIVLNNKGTGNQYVDSHLDVRLYNRDREEHPYDVMYVRPKDFFYVGFHARNTRRLPFDVTIRVGDLYRQREDVHPPLLARPLAY